MTANPALGWRRCVDWLTVRVGWSPALSSTTLDSRRHTSTPGYAVDVYVHFSPAHSDSGTLRCDVRVVSLRPCSGWGRGPFSVIVRRRFIGDFLTSVAT